MIEEIADLIEQVEDGHASALDVYALLDDLSKQAAEAMKQIKTQAITELDQHGSEGKELFGKRYTVGNTAKYEYEYPSFIADALQEATEAKKEYEALAKKQKAGIFYASPEGEAIEVIPAKKLVTTTIKGTKVKGHV